MLLEIQSDVFKLDKTHVRPKITFTDGLNVVLGESNAGNSIGKSLFLMIIDYCFGGSDYHDKEIIRNNIYPKIGNHTIKFAFKFDEEIYYFSREYENSGSVNICDEDYKVTKTIGLDDFNNFLREKYQIKETSFRGAVGRFVRDYLKGNIDTIKPFKDFPSQSDQEQISYLIKLFEMFSPIKEAHTTANTLKENKDAISKAQKFELIHSINKTKYNENLKTIASLKNRLEELKEAVTKGDKSLDELTLQRISDLTDQIKEFRQQKYAIQRKIKSIDSCLDKNSIQFEHKFNKLKDYFSDINVQKLMDIESFHSSLTSILSDELTSNKEKLQENLKLIDVQILELQDELKKIKPQNQKIDLASYDEYSEINSKIKRLETENKSYDNIAKVKDQYNKAVNDLKDLQKDINLTIESKINDEIKNLTETYFPQGDAIPNLIIESPSKYHFSNPDDIGAGTTYKGIFLLDLSLMILTKLPFVVHDSNLFKNLSDKRVESIFKIYKSIKKQSFVAFDRLSTYTKETQDIIQKHTILTLSIDQRLFGMNFLEKNED